MYFNKINNFYHGIMFHHFHDNIKHKNGEGSLNKDEFHKIIKFIGRENILDSEEFFSKLKEKKLRETDVCLTFDDGNLSQFDVALPVLEDLKIKGYFFLYSSVFQKDINFLEIYRYFRINFYDHVNDFYNEFFKNININLNKFFEKKKDVINNNLKNYPYYSLKDLQFRIIRNEVLTKQQYHGIMLSMFADKKFDYKDIVDKMFLKSNSVKDLNNLGHSIGLHSHTHPASLSELSYDEQLYEYKENLKIISSLLGIDRKKIKCMSHPSGSYNDNTIEILKSLGIEIGFSNVMGNRQFNFSKINKTNKSVNNSDLEICRQDHSKIFGMMKN